MPLRPGRERMLEAVTVAVVPLVQAQQQRIAARREPAQEEPAHARAHAVRSATAAWAIPPGVVRVVRAVLEKPVAETEHLHGGDAAAIGAAVRPTVIALGAAVPVVASLRLLARRRAPRSQITRAAASWWTSVQSRSGSLSPTPRRCRTIAW